jgi:hypothetical protein
VFDGGAAAMCIDHAELVAVVEYARYRDVLVS